RKEQAAERLTQLRAENDALEKQFGQNLPMGKTGASSTAKSSGQIPQGEEFQRYVNVLRHKSNSYKRKRQEINDMTAELQLLKRTEELLKEQVEQIKGRMGMEERKQGIEGYFSTQERLEELSTMKMEQDELKGKTLDEITGLIKTLNNRISSKKAELDPILKEVKPLRAKIQELRNEYEAKKSRYDALNANFETSRSTLESEVRGFYEEQYAQESRFHTLRAQMLINAVQLKRANDEQSSYMSKDKATKSNREQLNKQINDCEVRVKNNRERQKQTKDVQIDGTKQLKYWRDLLRMMELKRKIAMGES
ncbi:unnamed protein product, partial [Adineta steineri]